MLESLSACRRLHFVIFPQTNVLAQINILNTLIIYFNYFSGGKYQSNWENSCSFVGEYVGPNLGQHRRIGKTISRNTNSQRDKSYERAGSNSSHHTATYCVFLYSLQCYISKEFYVFNLGLYGNGNVSAFRIIFRNLRI